MTYAKPSLQRFGTFRELTMETFTLGGDDIMGPLGPEATKAKDLNTGGTTLGDHCDVVACSGM